MITVEEFAKLLNWRSRLTVIDRDVQVVTVSDNGEQRVFRFPERECDHIVSLFNQYVWSAGALSK